MMHARAVRPQYLTFRLHNATEPAWWTFYADSPLSLMGGILDAWQCGAAGDGWALEVLTRGNRWAVICPAVPQTPEEIDETCDGWLGDAWALFYGA